MATTQTKTEGKKPDQGQEMAHPRMKVTEFQDFMFARKGQIEALLAGYTTYERFEMVAMIAVQGNPDLLYCHPASLFTAFRESAQKQLLPDGKDGVVTCYDTRNGKVAKFNPMYQGLLRKAVNDPAIRKIETNVVGENDEFDYVEGTAPEVRLKKNLKMGSGELIGSYCLITLENGEIMLEVMDRMTALAVKDQSKGKNTPWHGPFESEMWRKAVFRRAIKWAPISQETKDALGSDDDHFVDADPVAKATHPDNHTVTSEPPNPHQAKQLTQQQTTQMPDLGDQRERELVENGGGGEVEQQKSAATNLPPDDLLKAFKADLDMADSDEEVDAAVDEWRDRMADLFPPDLAAAEAIVSARRKAVKSKKK